MIVGPTNRLEDATYIPPAPNLVEEYMSNLEKYINDEYEDDFGYIARTAIIHGQFETIHHKAILFMFNKPIFTIKKMEKETGVSYNTARRYVTSLAENGKIYGDDKKRNRVFSFYDLINLL